MHGHDTPVRRAVLREPVPAWRGLKGLSRKGYVDLGRIFLLSGDFGVRRSVGSGCSGEQWDGMAARVCAEQVDEVGV